MKARNPRTALTEIFDAAVKSVDPFRMVKERLKIEGRTLKVRGEGGGETAVKSFDLEKYDRILVAGAGKASGSMAKALEETLGDRVTGGCVAVKDPPGEPPARIRLIRAGHPVPDENSVRAADEIVGMAQGLSRQALERTLLVVLISGGGSSLLVSPLRWDLRSESSSSSGTRILALADIQATTDALLASGAPIQAMNCVRKHLSNITGGKLARRFYPATILVLILSDVVGDRLDTIASGPTAPDRTTYEDALSVIRRYGMGDKVPRIALEALEAGKQGRIEETPKSDDPAFERVHNLLIGSNRIALSAALRKADEMGYNTLCLSSRITGEAREVAKVLFGVAREVAESEAFALSGGPARSGEPSQPDGSHSRKGFPVRGGVGRGGVVFRPVARPACVLAGGETTVTLRGNGKGGRNQELALSFLAEMGESEGREKDIWLLSASTDGTDGPTDAAGAFASPEILEESERLGLDPADFLMNNDSYTFFLKTGYLYKSGPTGTNVCDLQIILVP